MPADPQDLLDTATASMYLAAGGLTLSTAQSAALQALVTAASKEFCRECKRQFKLTAYDEVLTPLPGQPDKGEPDVVLAGQFPVQSVTRVASGRTPALTVANADRATNQRATAAYSFTGDPEIAVTRTGLNLTTWASGVVSVASPGWTLTSPFTTVQALAATVNAIGSGWQATPAPGMGGWPCADLWGPLSPLPAFAGASLDLFADDLAADLDADTGTFRLPTSAASVQWWPNDTPAAAGFRGPVRLTYTAGWAVVPEPVQRAASELVAYALARLGTDPALQSENAKDYSYTVRDAWRSVPDWVRDVAAKYRVVR